MDPTQEVVVRDIHLLRQSAIDLRLGGMETGDSVGHIRVLDIPNQQMFIVPVNRTAINALLGQGAYVLSQTEEPEDADVEDAEEP